MKIEIEVLYIAFRINPEMETEVWYGDMIEKNMKDLLENLYKARDKYIFLTIPDFYKKMFAHHYVCTKKDCEFKDKELYDVNECMDHHPTLVNSFITHDLGWKVKVIPKKYSKYTDVCRKAANNGIRFVEVPD